MKNADSVDGAGKARERLLDPAWLRRTIEAQASAHDLRAALGDMRARTVPARVKAARRAKAKAARQSRKRNR